MLLGFAAVLKAIAWPAVAVLAFYMFRESIIDFIKRVQRWEASPSGLKTEMLPPSQQNESLKEVQLSNEAKASLEFSPLDPAYTAEYQRIDAIIEQNNSAKLADHLEAVKRMFAVAATEKKYEIIHRLIFNSQIQAIISTNSVGGKIAKSELHNIYSVAASQYPAIYANITFDQWIQFLLNTGLMTVSDMAANLIMYEVTPFARMYLQYAVGAQLPPRSL